VIHAPDAQQGGFAAAGGADQAGHLEFGKGEAHLAERAGRPIEEAEPVDHDLAAVGGRVVLVDDNKFGAGPLMSRDVSQCFAHAHVFRR
jgi:hypothetical protein